MNLQKGGGFGNGDLKLGRRFGNIYLEVRIEFGNIDFGDFTRIWKLCFEN